MANRSNRLCNILAISASQSPLFSVDIEWRRPIFQMLLQVALRRSAALRSVLACYGFMTLDFIWLGKNGVHFSRILAGKGRITKGFRSCAGFNRVASRRAVRKHGDEDRKLSSSSMRVLANDIRRVEFWRSRSTTIPYLPSTQERFHLSNSTYTTFQWLTLAPLPPSMPILRSSMRRFVCGVSKPALFRDRAGADYLSFFIVLPEATRPSAHPSTNCDGLPILSRTQAQV